MTLFGAMSTYAACVASLVITNSRASDAGAGGVSPQSNCPQ
jgi:hypothetical protein